MKKSADRINNFKDSIFGIMSRLAREHNAINLSQGFPDFDGAEWVKDLACEKIKKGFNQYAPFHGTQNLREAISHYYNEFYKLNYDPESEITVTVGATEAIYLIVQAMVNPGDEVIVLEPFYDSYVASIQMAGGIPIPVTMHAPDFLVDIKELESQINSKTKLLILNTPHNPTGKVFTREEIMAIGELVEKHDLFLLSDEVYEFLLFDAVHVPSATLLRLKERTFTVSSAGKTFGLTGWKIGWICAPKELTRAVRLVHQYVTFAVSTPMQEAVADSLKMLKTYVPEFQGLYRMKRDYFYSALSNLGFEFNSPKGTYFMMVPIQKKTKLKDVEFAMNLIENYKVATVPPSAFYLKSNDGTNYLRFCFAKKEETLKQAIENLKRL